MAPSVPSSSTGEATGENQPENSEPEVSHNVQSSELDLSATSTNLTTVKPETSKFDFACCLSVCLCFGFDISTTINYCFKFMINSSKFLWAANIMEVTILIRYFNLLKVLILNLILNCAVSWTIQAHCYSCNVWI